MHFIEVKNQQMADHTGTKKAFEKVRYWDILETHQEITWDKDKVTVRFMHVKSNSLIRVSNKKDVIYF